MIEPKTFYRKMDGLLNQIATEPNTPQFLPTILEAIETTFGSEIHIQHGRLYQEIEDTFLRIHPEEESVDELVAEMPAQSEAIQQVVRHGSYIFDAPDLPHEFHNEDAPWYSVPVAFSVIKGPLQRWLFVYDLGQGWNREEIQLCFNAIRFALNTRLMSDTFMSDLQQAAQIQRSLLPSKAPKFDGYEIAGRSHPATVVGGDLYDFNRLGKDILGITIGDASGHGLPAALLVRDVVTGLRMGLEEQFKIVHTIRKLNNVIHRSTLSTRFISLFYCELERNGNVLYVNAGHPGALLVSEGKVTELEPTTSILGPLPELHPQRAYAFLKPGDVLVLYTDGLIERWDANDQIYELEWFKELVVANAHLSPRDLSDFLYHTMDDYGNGAAWNDDASIVVIKRLA